jgi:hypothetical protein
LSCSLDDLFKSYLSCQYYMWFTIST